MHSRISANFQRFSWIVCEFQGVFSITINKTIQILQIPTRQKLLPISILKSNHWTRLEAAFLQLKYDINEHKHARSLPQDWRTTVAFLHTDI